jgi:SAM-dependent MidA family methyltransferase
MEIQIAHEVPPLALSEIIKQKIIDEDLISFHDFMEMCLYYPGLGYYASSTDKIGMKGDYYTSPTLSPAFGAMLGKQLEEMWQNLGEVPFTIVEYGAGTGKLCHDILGYLKQNPKMYEELRYCIIEKSEAMKEKEKKILPEKVSWYNSIDDIPDLVGCVLSNELVDNFSVHRVVMEEALMEVFVGYEDGFVEILKPAGKELLDYFSELKVDLPKGFQTEINLQAKEWMKEIASALKKGYVLTIDYGYSSFELYNEFRRKGTLSCYSRHLVSNQPFKNIGEQDITTPVNFSALCLWGFQNGLEYCGYTDQAHFLLALGLCDYFKSRRGPDWDCDEYKKQLFVTHALIEDMGIRFKVLIQQKGAPGCEITGLKR